MHLIYYLLKTRRWKCSYKNKK